MDSLTTTVGTKADDNVVVKTSGDQTIAGQKSWTGAQINIGGLYTAGTVSFSGTGNRAVTIQSSNPGGGVNSELRLVTADNTDAGNIAYNTGVLKYNGATNNSGGDTASVTFLGADLNSGADDHIFTSFAGYLYWGTGWYRTCGTPTIGWCG
jgi:hypothetical protein